MKKMEKHAIEIDYYYFNETFEYDVKSPDKSTRKFYIEKLTGLLIVINDNDQDAPSSNDNRRLREWVLSDQDGFLLIPVLTQSQKHDILKDFLASDWTDNKKLHQKVHGCYSGSHEDWVKEMIDRDDIDSKTLISLFSIYYYESVGKLKDNFLSGNGIVYKEEQILKDGGKITSDALKYIFSLIKASFFVKTGLKRNYIEPIDSLEFSQAIEKIKDKDGVLIKSSIYGHNVTFKSEQGEIKIRSRRVHYLVKNTPDFRLVFNRFLYNFYNDPQGSKKSKEFSDKCYDWIKGYGYTIEDVNSRLEDILPPWGIKIVNILLIKGKVKHNQLTIDLGDDLPKSYSYVKNKSGNLTKIFKSDEAKEFLKNEISRKVGWELKYPEKIKRML